MHVCIRAGVVSLFLLGCNADANDASAIEDRLSRIEAQLDRIDERMQSFEHTAAFAQSVAIDLPKTDSSPVLSRITIAVTQNQLLVNDDVVASTALQSKLEQLAATSPDASVVIQADAEVEHQRIIHLLDTIKKAGFGHVAIATPSED